MTSLHVIASILDLMQLATTVISFKSERNLLVATGRHSTSSREAYYKLYKGSRKTFKVLVQDRRRTIHTQRKL
jgi:hypothetical protein